MCDLKDFKSLFFAERIVFVISSEADSCVEPSPVSASSSSLELKASVPTCNGCCERVSRLSVSMYVVIPFETVKTKARATIPSIADSPKTMLLPLLLRRLARTKPSFAVNGTDTARGF